MATEDKARYNRELQGVKASALYERLMTLKPPEPPKETVAKETAAKTNKGNEHDFKETNGKGPAVKETVATTTKSTKHHQSNGKPAKDKIKESESKGSESKVCDLNVAKTTDCKTKAQARKAVSFSEKVTVKHIPIVQTPPQTNG